MPQPQLRRRFTDPNTGESFDVVYRDARMVVFDGLREVVVVPVSRMAEDGYRLDLNERVQSLARWDIFTTPKAALAGAVDYLYKQRGSDIGSEACMERFARGLPAAST